MQVTFHQTDAGETTAREIILRGLTAYNESHVGKHDHRPLIILLQDVGGATIGGLWGRTAWRWLYVELLFVPERFRGAGLGRELMRRAEAEALKRGCRAAWLDTFSFQARGFYKKFGYTVFGTLDEYPPGRKRFFLRKVLRVRRPSRKIRPRTPAARTRPRSSLRARS